MARHSWFFLNTSVLCLVVCVSGCGLLGSGQSSDIELEPLKTVNNSVQGNDAIASLSTQESSIVGDFQQIVPNALGGSLQVSWNSSNAQGHAQENFVLDAGLGSTFQVTELSAPARLVIDLENFSKRINSGQAIEVPSSTMVDRVRFGQHPDKDRIVFDLKQEQTQHKVERSIDGQIIIAFATNVMPSTSIALNDLNKSDISNNLALNNVSKPEDIETIEKIEVMEESSEVSELKVETAQDTSAKLLNLALSPTSEGSEDNVVAKMQSAGFYSLSKSAPSEYILTLEDTKLSETASKDPIMSEKKSGSIRSVRAVQSGKNVQLRIFSKPEALLKANVRGDEIVVSALNPTTDRALSQVDVAKVEESAVVADSAKEDMPAVEKVDVKIADDDDLAANASEENLDNLLEKQYTGRVISLDLQETDIDNALRIIAEVSNLNIIASDDVKGKVTLRLIDVPWDQALDVILKTNALDMVQEGNVVRIAPVDKLRKEREDLKQAQQAEEELEPLKVQYVRISYAKASEIQPLVESVLTERGSVTYDDRTNQLIIKDIAKGIKNVVKLVEKIDLRTPQVLIETQIVEANKTFARELGTELGFYFLRTPETGNPTGYNFPNSIQVGGSAADAAGKVIPGRFSNFAAGNQASAISMLFGSADGSKGLDLRLSQGEREGLVKVISKPSVAVTNNSPAVIKSVEKIRIKLPSGGTNIGVGNGANAGAAAGGGASVATETFEVGIVLNVTAQASPDYYVLMDIEAESSTLGSPTRGADNIPTEIERTATSSVLVSSGQTFAMGGIYKVSQNDISTGVPFLRNIPVLGQFFRNSSVVNTDEELIFFITPRVVEGSFDDASMQSVS